MDPRALVVAMFINHRVSATRRRDEAARSELVRAFDLQAQGAGLAGVRKEMERRSRAAAAAMALRAGGGGEAAAAAAAAATAAAATSAAPLPPERAFLAVPLAYTSFDALTAQRPYNDAFHALLEA